MNKPEQPDNKISNGDGENPGNYAGDKREQYKKNTRCFHCNETVPANVDINLDVNGTAQPMCCQGCLAVCSTIVGAGLQDYYRFRSGRADTPDAGSEDFAMYNQPAVLKVFSTRSDGCWESRLSIGGMHCAACAWLIEKRLESNPGVELASVNFQRGVATIVWDDAAIKAADLFQAIHTLGYRAAPYSASRSEQLAQQQLDALLGRLGVAGIGMMQIGMVAIGLYAGEFQDISAQMRDLLRYFSMAVATPVLFYSAQPFFKGALRNLRSRTLGMDVPVSIALLSAYIASVYATLMQQEHVYFDTISMFTFFLLLGRYLQMAAQKRHAASGTLIPVTARLRLSTSPERSEWRALQQLRLGDVVIVQPGETIPVDGKVLQGSSAVDESAFTGEFAPRSVAPDTEVTAGTRNIDGSLHIALTAMPSAFKLQHIDQLMQQALQGKPALAKAADRIAAYFVLLVLIISAASLVFWYAQDPGTALLIALAVLVVSCPCALSLATPATFTAAIYGLRDRGIVVADAAVLERVPDITHAVFDKTGTLTVGKPQLEHIEIASKACSEGVLLAVAATLEQHSAHPIARAFDAIGERLDASNVKVASGQGVAADINGEHWRIGHLAFCSEGGLNDKETSALAPHWTGQNPQQVRASSNRMQVYLSRNGELVAQLQLADALRPDAKRVIDALEREGVAVQILSGDRSLQVRALAEQLGIKVFRGGCSAEDKMHYVKELQQQGAVVMMVGDGVNDAPVIASADVSVAMTQASDLTRSNANVNLVTDKLLALQQLFFGARRARRILRQNFGWALAYNLTALPLAAAGLVPPYLAAIGMSASSLIVVFNAMRAGNREHIAQVQGDANSRWQAAKQVAANG